MPIKKWTLNEIDELLREIRRRAKKAEGDVLLIPIRYPPGSNFPVGPCMQAI